MANRIFETLSQWIELDDAELDAEIRKTGARGIDAKQARPGAPAVRVRAGDAGRAQGADHPRLLHAAAPAVPVRGQCRRALPRAGGDRAEPDAGGHPASGPARGRADSPTARRPRARGDHPGGERLPVPDRAGRGDPRAQRDRAWLDHAGGLDGAAASFRPRSASSPATRSKASKQKSSTARTCRPRNGRAAADICARGSKNDQKQGEAFTAAFAATGAERVDTYFSVFLTDADDPRKTVITAALVRSDPDLARRITDEQNRDSRALRKAARRPWRAIARWRCLRSRSK